MKIPLPRDDATGLTILKKYLSMIFYHTSEGNVINKYQCTVVLYTENMCSDWSKLIE